jgi:hypothetical protein
VGKCHLSAREWAGLRGPVKTCSEEGINTDYSPDGNILGYRQGGILDVDVTEFYDKQRKKNAVERVSARPDVTDQFHYDKQGRKMRVRTTSQTLGFPLVAGSRMFEFVFITGSFSAGGTVTTRYNENDQPIEILIRNENGELQTKINYNYANGRLISETLVIVGPSRAALDQLQGQRIESSYTYDADGRMIRRLSY